MAQVYNAKARNIIFTTLVSLGLTANDFMKGGIATSERKAAFQLALDVLNGANLDGLTPPKSYKAIEMQVRWAITTQPLSEMPNVKIAEKNLVAASIVGFISPELADDIIDQRNATR